MFWHADVPESALILRKHGESSNLFSCLLFNELEAFNPRDQLAFAFVRDKMRPQIKLNMFEVEVFEQVSMEYRHNLKRLGMVSLSDTEGVEGTKKTKRARGIFVNDSCCSSCHHYLTEIWDESQ